MNNEDKKQKKLRDTRKELKGEEAETNNKQANEERAESKRELRREEAELSLRISREL